MFDFIKNFYSRDKILHTITSASVMMFIVLFVGSSWLFATIVTIIIGVLKEYVWDLYLDKGKFDYMDIVANLIGISLVLLIAVLFGVAV